MTQFSYTARDNQGQLMSGLIAAGDLATAGKLLCAQGKFVVALAPASLGGKSRSLGGPALGRIGRDEVIYFANQMAVMVDTGVPLVDALEGLTRLAPNPKFQAVLEAVTAKTRAGTSFSEALAEYPKVFPSIMIALVRAGEASGTMGPMLEQVASYLDREQQMLKQVRGALIYPAFMVLLCTTVTIFLLTFVLPRFASIYATKQAALPLPTLILMALSGALVGHWVLWLLGAGGLLLGGLLWLRSPRGQRQLDWLKLHAPIFRAIFRKLYLSRAMRTLGTMISAGVPLLDAIAIVRGVTRNAYYDRFWDDAEQDVRRGLQLSESMYQSSLIPNPVAQMVQSGERSGRMSQVLARVAAFAESDFEQTVKSNTQFLEPVMIMAMGCIIGFIAIALLLPIFSIGRVMAKG